MEEENVSGFTKFKLFNFENANNNILEPAVSSDDLSLHDLNREINLLTCRSNNDLSILNNAMTDDFNSD